MNKAIGTGQILARIIQQNGHFMDMCPLNFSHVLGHGLLLLLEQPEDHCGRKGAFLYFQPYGEWIFKSVFNYDCNQNFNETVFGPTVTIAWVVHPTT